MSTDFQEIALNYDFTASFRVDGFVPSPGDMSSDMEFLDFQELIFRLIELPGWGGIAGLSFSSGPRGLRDHATGYP